MYAFLKADEDRRVAEHQERRSVAASLLSEFGEVTSFVSPELLRVGSETVESYIAERPGSRQARVQPSQHPAAGGRTLSRSEAEQIIAATGPVVQGPERIYAMLSSSDMPFPTVTLSTGEEDPVGPGGVLAAPGVPEPGRPRKRVFDSFWKSWKGYEATLGQTLDTHVKAHVFEAKAT